jgi:hypothetical protein
MTKLTTAFRSFADAPKATLRRVFNTTIPLMWSRITHRGFTAAVFLKTRLKVTHTQRAPQELQVVLLHTVCEREHYVPDLTTYLPKALS